MTEKEVFEELKKIYDERNRKGEEVEAKAKAEGKWLHGLDSNRDLYIELDKEAKFKIKELQSKICFMTNAEWFYFDDKEQLFKLTDKAPQEAIDSYNEYYRERK